MTKKNPGSGVTGSFLEYKFLYCLAVLFYDKYVLLLYSGEKNEGESIFKKVMHLSVIWFTQFIFPNFRLKINLERKLQLWRKDNKVTNPLPHSLNSKSLI